MAEINAKTPEIDPKTLSTVSTGHLDSPEKPQIIVDKGKTYTRDTHPLLFEVVDLLEKNKELRDLTVRKLSERVQAGKSWCAVAKRYWQNENT